MIQHNLRGFECVSISESNLQKRRRSPFDPMPRGAVTLDRFGGYFFTTELQASDLGSERDSRTFMITVSALDNAGNQSFSSTAVVVPRD
jgi:hypothetical protein